MPKIFPVNLPEDLLKRNLFRANEEYYNPSMQTLALSLAKEGASVDVLQAILLGFNSAQKRKSWEPRSSVVIVNKVAIFSTFENGYHVCLATADEVVKRFDEIKASGFSYIQLVCFQLRCEAEIVTLYNQKLLVQGFNVRNEVLTAGCMRFGLDYLLPKIQQMRAALAQ